MAALTKITDAELLEKVKKVLGVTGSFNDDVLKLLIIDIKFYLIDAGMHKIAVDSEAAIGVIARGVADLWNLGSGTVDLSPYFKERAAQAALTYPSKASIIHESGEENV